MQEAYTVNISTSLNFFFTYNDSFICVTYSELFFRKRSKEKERHRWFL